MSNKPTRINRFIDRFEEYDETRKMISYKAMRRNIGILGIALPFLLIIGSAVFYNCCSIQVSISQYYHSGMRDLFVGILAFVAIFLFSYRGYNNLDRISGIIAGLGALGVAFFPSLMFQLSGDCLNKCVVSNDWKTIVHLISAFVFFITIALISIFLFTRTSNKEGYIITREKIIRNKVYRICGIIILVSLALIILYKILLMHKYPVIDNLRPIFWLETIALIAFGISWLVKGEATLTDKK